MVCQPEGEGFHGQEDTKTRIVKGIKFWTEEFIFFLNLNSIPESGMMR